ncbi:MAG: TetR family transcriptional regulator [Ardenticatenales bacterium]|nr:TetR family transcriptional regulator [Ardenticatenales bacterium]
MSSQTGEMDLRVRRTRLALRNALLSLIEEKGFDSIIVQEIADRAMINRGTFYKHYRDKYDLLEQTMQELLSELSAPVATLLQVPEDQAVLDALVHWLEQVARYASFYRMMLGRSGNAAFAAHLLRYLETIVAEEYRRQRIKQRPGTLEESINLRFIAAGFLGVTAWWLEQKQPLPVRDVATQLHALLKTIMPDPKAS